MYNNKLVKGAGKPNTKDSKPESKCRMGGGVKAGAGGLS